MAANTTTKVRCPRCSGSGIYEGYGICFRCRGAGEVNPTPARRPQAAIVETAEAKEARLRASMGDADYEIVFADEPKRPVVRCPVTGQIIMGGE